MNHPNPINRTHMIEASHLLDGWWLEHQQYDDGAIDYTTEQGQEIALATMWKVSDALEVLITVPGAPISGALSTRHFVHDEDDPMNVLLNAMWRTLHLGIEVATPRATD